MSTQTKKATSDLGRRYLQVTFVWNPIINVIITLLFMREMPATRSFLIGLTISTVICNACFGLCVAVRTLEVWLALRRGRAAPQRGAGWYFALSMVAMPFGLWLANVLVALIFHVGAPSHVMDYAVSMMLTVLIAGAFFLWYARVDARSAEREARLRVAEMEKGELTAQLAALTARVNPHLLFNALNTVAALIPTNPALAEETVLRLAELYRGVLTSSRHSSHPLAEELRICSAYLDVERARFGERLRVEVHMADALDLEAISVPVLLLQPLVENAVKHGLSDRASGGALTIRGALYGDGIELRIEDDGVGLGESTRVGAFTGLETTRQRLALCYGSGASLELSPRDGGGTNAVLRLPRAA